MARKKKGDQQELPGVMPDLVDFPEINRLAKQIKDQRSEWQRIGGEISKLNDNLVDAMHKRTIATYVSKHLAISLVPGKERVRIKDLAEEAEDAA